MSMFLVSFVFGQKTITGTVSDAKTKEALLGVLVMVEGTTIGTTTDINGKYSINAPANAKNLVFSMIGMTSSTQIIGTSTVIDVALSSNETMLKDVIVTAVGIKREARSLGYSTTTIKDDDLNRTSDRSALNELQGKVAGVNISSGQGSPGSSTRIVMRGGNSILGNQQALIIVDGVPTNNNAFGVGDDFNGKSDVLNKSIDYGNRGNDINPQDIASITVLKGPAATALYGSRAANGAVIITTKSGKSDAKAGRKFKVSINSSTSFQNVLRFPEFQNEFGQGGGGAPDTRENWSWGPKFDGTTRPWGQQILDDSGNVIQKVKTYEALPNNVRSFFNTGITLNNNISIQGGTEKTNYYLSYNNLTNKGVIPTTAYGRNSIKLNVGHEFSEKLSTTASFNYIRTKGDLINQGQGTYSVYDQIIQTPRDIPIQELRDLNDPFNSLETYYGAYTQNPYYVLNNQKNDNTVDRFLTTLGLEYQANKWLGFTARLGNDYATDARYERMKRFAVTDGGQNDGQHFDGLYSEDIYRTNELNTDFIAHIDHKFKHDIGIKFLLGNNINQRSIKNTYASTNGLIIPDFYNLKNSEGRPIVENRTSLRRMVGVYSSIDLSWKNMIFLGVTARNDWSSTLPKSNRSYFYPSVNGAWVFSELIKENNGKILSFGKLRASWASVGTDANPYQLTNVFVPAEVGDGFANSTVTQPFPGAGGTDLVPAYTISNVGGNPNLKPERTSSWEVGLEASLWKDRIWFDVSYYQAKNKDQIFPVSVAPSSGLASQIINGGVVTNKGIEIAAKIIPVSLKNSFKWEVYGTYTKNNNKVVSLNDGVDQIVLGGFSNMSIVAKVGEEYGSFYSQTTKKDPNGNVVVSAETGLPVLNDKPEILGSFQPKFLASWGTKLSYKGLSFNILFDTRQGGLLYCRTKDLQEFVGTSPNTLLNDREDAIMPNSVIETAPGVYEANTSVTYSSQDYWTDQADASTNLISGSFVKLREASLSYQLPMKWFKNTKSITGLQISIFGNNLALWTPKANTYVDPETSSYGNGNAQGFEYGTTPSLRNMGFSIKADF